MDQKPNKRVYVFRIFSPNPQPATRNPLSPRVRDRSGYELLHSGCSHVDVGATNGSHHIRSECPEGWGE